MATILTPEAAMKLAELPAHIDSLLADVHADTADHAGAQDELKTMIGYVQTAVAAIEAFPQKVAALAAKKQASGQKLLDAIHAHLTTVVAGTKPGAETQTITAADVGQVPAGVAVAGAN